MRCCFSASFATRALLKTNEQEIVVDLTIFYSLFTMNPILEGRGNILCLIKSLPKESEMVFNAILHFIRAQRNQDI